MKKNTIKLLSLLLVAGLMTGCTGQSNAGGSSDNASQDSQTSESGNQSSDQSSEGSEGSESSSSEIQPEYTLDDLCADFLDGTGLSVPSLAAYEMEYEFFYYYQYEMYVIAGECVGAHEAEFLAEVEKLDWVVYNDEDYTVEEYGYMFADDFDDANVELDFYDEEGVFCFSLYRYDGKYGKADVSNIDTSWYVDYVRFADYQLTDTLPAEELKQALYVNKTISGLDEEKYIYSYVRSHIDDSGYLIPDTFSIGIDGDQVEAVASLFEGQGYTLTPHMEMTIDWDTWELVEYVGSYNGYDSECELYVEIRLEEFSNITFLDFSRFGDVLSGQLSENTDWTEDEKGIMSAYLGSPLPFFQMGNNYIVGRYEDATYPYVYIMDNYYLDRTSEIAQTLLNNGFEADSTSYDATVYVRDDKTTYVEVWLNYDNGNQVMAYYEPTHYVAATNIELNIHELDIVAGMNYELSVEMLPMNAESTYEFSSNDEEVATVNEVGTVSINMNANVGDLATITVTTSEGLTDTCTFHVVADEVTDIKLNVQELKLAAGESFSILVEEVYPYGADGGALVVEQKDPANEHVSISAGVITISEEAEVGETATILVSVEGTSVQKEIPLTVVPQIVVDALNQSFFGLTDGDTQYAEHHATGESGTSYTAVCAAAHGVQLRSKNSNSGIIAHNETRTAKSITVTFDANTEAPNERRLDIYASNEPFTIADMYGSMEPVGSLTFDKNNLTKTYEFTEEYSYIGLRSASGAIYLTEIQIAW